MKNISIAALALSIAGCASITEGTSQTIHFEADRPCTVTRGSERYETTPDEPKVTLRKARQPLKVECASSTKTVEAHASAAALTGAALLDFGIVDMITGAFWKYPDIVEVGK